MKNYFHNCFNFLSWCYEDLYCTQFYISTFICNEIRVGRKLRLKHGLALEGNKHREAPPRALSPCAPPPRPPTWSPSPSLLFLTTPCSQGVCGGEAAEGKAECQPLAYRCAEVGAHGDLLLGFHGRGEEAGFLLKSQKNVPWKTTCSKI